VFELYTTSGAAWPLASEQNSPAAGVFTQAAWDRDRKRLVLDLLNYSERPAGVNFDLSALGLKAGTAEIRELLADSLMAHITSANPDAIRREDSHKELSRLDNLTVAARPFSITQVIVKRR